MEGRCKVHTSSSSSSSLGRVQFKHHLSAHNKLSTFLQAFILPPDPYPSSLMAAIATHQLASCITCHVWNSDLSMVAVCPNSNEVHIYKASPAVDSVWERVYVLQKHDQLISGIDWGPISNRLVTASHDRNSYVWSLEGNSWNPTLVILRLNRAATSVKWSPKENKFAVGSGARSVCICYYETENNWWVSKIIRKKHSSTVTSVAWHPNNVLLATTSTDCKCRVFSAYIKGVDSRGDANTSFGEIKFGEQLVELNLGFSWTFGVKWSPSGNAFSYVGHDSTICFAKNVGRTTSSQIINLHGLPLRDVLFLSENRLVAGGFDCNPMLFVADKKGTWRFLRYLDEQKLTTRDNKVGSQFSEAFGKFYGQAKHGTALDAVEPSKISGVSHENCITSISPVPAGGSEAFSTSGLDGRVVIWDLKNLNDAFTGLHL